MNKHNFDYTEAFYPPSLSYSFMFRSRPLKVILWETVLKTYSKFIWVNPCRSVISIKLLWHQLLVKPGPRPWTLTLDPDPEKPGSWKAWETVGCKKKIVRLHIIIYYNTKILQEETCKPAIWKNCNWGFLGTQ